MIYTATSSGKWLLLLHVYSSLMASGKGASGAGGRRRLEADVVARYGSHIVAEPGSARQGRKPFRSKYFTKLAVSVAGIGRKI